MVAQFTEEDIFVNFMTDYIMETRNLSREEAERKANQFFFRATFDGQGGRRLDFSPRWDKMKAKEIVEHEYERLKREEEIC